MSGLGESTSESQFVSQHSRSQQESAVFRCSQEQPVKSSASRSGGCLIWAPLPRCLLRPAGRLVLPTPPIRCRIKEGGMRSSRERSNRSHAGPASRNRSGSRRRPRQRPATTPAPISKSGSFRVALVFPSSCDDDRRSETTTGPRPVNTDRSHSLFQPGCQRNRWMRYLEIRSISALSIPASPPTQPLPQSNLRRTKGPPPARDVCSSAGTATVADRSWIPSPGVLYGPQLP